MKERDFDILSQIQWKQFHLSVRSHCACFNGSNSGCLGVCQVCFLAPIRIERTEKTEDRVEERDVSSFISPGWEKLRLPV